MILSNWIVPGHDVAALPHHAGDLSSAEQLQEGGRKRKVNETRILHIMIFVVDRCQTFKRLFKDDSVVRHLEGARMAKTCKVLARKTPSTQNS